MMNFLFILNDEKSHRWNFSIWLTVKKNAVLKKKNNRTSWKNVELIDVTPLSFVWESDSFVDSHEKTFVKRNSQLHFDFHLKHKIEFVSFVFLFYWKFIGGMKKKRSCWVLVRRKRKRISSMTSMFCCCFSSNCLIKDFFWLVSFGYEREFRECNV